MRTTEAASYDNFAGGVIYSLLWAALVGIVCMLIERRMRTNERDVRMRRL